MPRSPQATAETRTAPVAVIGAGLSGLAAGLELARHDVPVVLFEAAADIGGCCSNDERDGFVFDNGAIYVAVPSLLRTAFRRFGLDLEREVPMTRIERPVLALLDDGTAVHLSDARTSRVEGVDAGALTQRLQDGLGALQRQWSPIYRTLVDEVLPEEPSLLRTLGKLWRYLPRMRGNASRLIEAHFPDQELRAAVASVLLYTGIAPDRLPATQLMGLVALLEEGFHLPTGGMGAIGVALRRELSRLSVPIRCGTAVREIVVDDGGVRGLALANGERVVTDRVIATCSGHEVVRRLLPREAVPRALASTARRAPISLRAISIQIGCSAATLPDAFIVNHVPPMTQQGAMHVLESGTPRWLSYTNPTVVVPARAPPGKSVLELYAPATDIGTALEWPRSRTEAVAADYLNALRRRVSGLSVESIRVRDPRDFALAHHLYEGALYGIAPGATPDRYFPHRSGVQGLHLAGQTTFPGYGVAPSILSGIQAASALLRDARPS
jgi:phytoene desaturase